MISIEPVLTPVAVEDQVNGTESEETIVGGEPATYQAYEVLQGLTPVSANQGAYLITQPQANPAISFTTNNMATDHIIVHTLPVNQVLPI